MKPVDWLKRLFKGVDGVDTHNGCHLKAGEHLDKLSEYRVWYRGDAGELSDFFSGAVSHNCAERSRFWRVSGANAAVRKAHSGLPFLIVDKLAQIVTSDLIGVSFDPKEAGLLRLWQQIAAENDFDSLLYRAVSDTLVVGDGAFKLCADPSVSRFPIIEWVPAENVGYEYDRGKLVAVTFSAVYGEYVLNERYEPGRVTARLFKGERQVPLGTLSQTARLAPVAEYPGDFLMAVPCMFSQSPSYPHRGVSIYHTKGYLFDGLDEVLSQWLDAVRAGRVKTYIPESLLPRNPVTGRIHNRSAFDDAIIIADDMSEGAHNTLRTEQARIDYLAFQASYNTYVDACLQGVMSPATLGIDVKKLDNAESQREKEKATLSTRNKITRALQSVLPKLVECALKTCDIMRGRQPRSCHPSVRFSSYANPSFEAMVDTLSKAASSGILSEERMVEYLYSESLSPAQKAEEVQRLKQRRAESGR